MAISNKKLIELAESWFAARSWRSFPFQKAAWRAYLEGYDGLVNAPTGSGKTYSLIIPILLEFIKNNEADTGRMGNGIQAIWITPIRALTREIQQAAQTAADELGLHWHVAIRSGDTSSSERRKIMDKPPEILITTPESLHLLLATKGYDKYFATLQAVVVDEWHELMGSKRGVLMELALSRFKAMLPALKIWGISATIGNMEEALDVLLGPDRQQRPHRVIRAKNRKKIEIKTVLPDQIETFPWAGHLGLKLLDKVLPIIYASSSTLIFTNTRKQSELWYQFLLEADPELAGVIAMHHGSIDRSIRDWVEDALNAGSLKAVVCTSSLDLGVDFRPVETIIQIGSPKGVARFQQRAGRSGHQPGATSRIHFVPTHSLEIVESAALRRAMEDGAVENRLPYIRCFDILSQYLVTLSLSNGFRAEEILQEIRTTYAFASVTDDEWAWVIDFIATGGNSLQAYDDYQKVHLHEGKYHAASKQIAMRHRLSIGAIVSEAHLKVRFARGGYLGSIEEYFISQLSPGDVFWFAGRALKLVRIKDMEVQVKLSSAKKGRIPNWLGGRLPLSSSLSHYLRLMMDYLHHGIYESEELQKLAPLADVQTSRSHIPARDEFLIEYFQDKEGYHLLFYPFEGRFVHEGLGAILGYRISQLRPISFSIAMNDYGFELLSDSDIPIEEALAGDLFSAKNLRQDIQASINATELARRRFRDIASIAGLVFKGYPGNRKKEKHLQASSQLFFQVFSDYEPDNLLLAQAFEEVTTFQLQEARLRAALQRINEQRHILSRPEKATPFSFPIIVDRLREKLSSEKLEDRIRKMKLQLIRD